MHQTQMLCCLDPVPERDLALASGPVLDPDPVLVLDPVSALGWDLALALGLVLDPAWVPVLGMASG